MFYKNLTLNFLAILTHVSAVVSMLKYPFTHAHAATLSTNTHLANLSHETLLHGSNGVVVAEVEEIYVCVQGRGVNQLMILTRDSEDSEFRL